ncbi:MAG TPA: serine/threonine-protein kinase, partial [Thermoanaerobaculia bacterium]
MGAAKKLSTMMLPLTPTRLGRYEILEEIGKGAMGVVYLARDPLIGRLVALKTFRIGYSVKDQEMEQFRIRFMREAQSAGILTHPNIVTIHDVVEQSEEGLAFIAMEYVKGTNLKLLLQGDQPLSLRFVLDILSQVGDALDYAHANRVVHRDVKPANILITPDNKVKITDFGIARLESSNLTQEGQLLGTPNYMAPEQIQGKEVDHRADLFSLGVVLYEMLTRHKPFQGENLTVVSHRIVYDHFTPPRDYVHGLPSGIDRILARALEKDPARRYQRGREMVDDLRRLVEASSVQTGDLNETQSLSATVVLPSSTLPPPLPLPPAAAEKSSSLFSRWKKKTAPAPVPPQAPMADPGTGTGSRTGTGSSATPPPLVPDSAIADADTVSTAVPVLTPPRRKTTPRRILGAAAVGLILAVLVAAGLMLAGDWVQPDGAERDASEDAYRSRVLSLVDQAQRQADSQRYAEAVDLIRQAEELAPNWRAIPKLRKEMEERAILFDQLVGKELQVVLAAQDAQKSLDDQRYEEALSKATAVLQMQPGNRDAIEILAQAQLGMVQARQRQAATAPR